jgi:hypothetical protein
MARMNLDMLYHLVVVETLCQGKPCGCFTWIDTKGIAHVNHPNNRCQCERPIPTEVK